MKVAIVGAGLQARRRAPVIRTHANSELALICSPTLDSAEALAGEFRCQASANWEEAVSRDDIDSVVVCTPPDSHAMITEAALTAGKHVLCEKPLTRTLDEAERIVQVARAADRVLKCGFNHRYHPAIARAAEIVQSGAIGGVMWGKADYGICGRPGYEQEWRADPEVAAGGQLMEQGIHTVDLFRWLFGEFTSVTGFVQTSYWKIAPLEDSAFALFRTDAGAVASVFTGLTVWVNRFMFEVTGTDGYVRADGLGGGYGTESLTVGRREFEGPFKYEKLEFRGPDSSWAREWAEFHRAVTDGTPFLGTPEDGLEAMRLVQSVYESARTGKSVDPRSVRRSLDEC